MIPSGENCSLAGILKYLQAGPTSQREEAKSKYKTRNYSSLGGTSHVHFGSIAAFLYDLVSSFATSP